MLVAMLAALAAAAPEAAPATAPQAQAPAAATAKEKMVCKTEEVTGSRFPKKVCYSKAEYEEKQRLQQQELRQSQGGALYRR